MHKYKRGLGRALFLPALPGLADARALIHTAYELTMIKMPIKVV